MSEWSVRIFWKEVDVVPADDGFAVELDGRPLRTPSKSALALPTAPLAAAVAAEWRAQKGRVDPTTMPFTRSANSAIDKVRVRRQDVIENLAEYGATDLLCYRSHSPRELTEHQAREWDPLLEWCLQTFDAPLNTVSGVMPCAQPPESLNNLRREISVLDVFALTGFYDLVALSGSLVIALAAIREIRPLEQLWTLSRLDENWQMAQWGQDDDAVEAAEIKRKAFLHAKNFIDLSRRND